MDKLKQPITDLSTPLIDYSSNVNYSPRSHRQTNQSFTRRFIERGLSHVKGSENVPLLEVTIPELVAQTVRRFPQRSAAVFCNQGIKKNWQQLSDDIDRLAAGFLALGLQKGDRLGIWSPNRYEWLLTQFATARIGVILVTINPAYKVAELKHVLKVSGCKAIVMAERFKSSNYVEMFQKIAPIEKEANGTRRTISDLPNLKISICMHDANLTVPTAMISFDEVMHLSGPAQQARLEAVSADLKTSDAINIQFTSGTTGLPKGATLSHRNIVNNGKFVTDMLEFTENDKLCIPVPLYHCFGMVMGTLGCASKGSTMVFPGEGFDPSETIHAIMQERCSALYGVPTMFNAILSIEDFLSFDLSSLRTGVMAGAPCPIETMKQVVEDMHMSEVTIAYGMTETSPVSFQSNVDDPIERRVATVGRVHPHVECRVIDSDGNTVPVGQQGELCTRGYSVMKGYWDNAKQTKNSIDSDGWMHSGDLAVIDKDGYCNIVGRVKDMIIRGGENIYPKEIEDFLYQLPAIKDVQVFGVPDEKFGEQVCAWVVPKEQHSLQEQDIIEFCKDQISHYKVPRYVRIRKTLPMTVTGKAQKFKMRDEMIKELNLKTTSTA